MCDAMIQASKGKGNLGRKWGRKIQAYSYRVFQNYNIHGRFLRIEAWLGVKRDAIIIPENDYNQGWGDIANKILRFLGNFSDSRFNLACQQAKSYMEAAKILQWPSGDVQNAAQQRIEACPSSECVKAQFLSKCLVGVFNDTFNISPNPEVIQKWFINRWKVTAGLKVTQINHNSQHVPI